MFVLKLLALRADGVNSCTPAATQPDPVAPAPWLRKTRANRTVAAPLESAGVQVFEVCDYREQAMGRGVEASAIAYICIRTPDGKTRWGAGVDTSIELASIKAVLSALNRL